MGIPIFPPPLTFPFQPTRHQATMPPPMFKRFGKQYERGGYLKAIARQRLNATLDPKRFASDKAHRRRSRCG